MPDINKLIESLNTQCRNNLPGKSAHSNMLAKPRIDLNFPNLTENSIPSAVLILLYQDNEDIRFFLTERTEYVQHHKGQISLPGGSREKDEELQETAIRETEEEIGVPRNHIHIIGKLTPLFVKVTGYMIHPFIGYIDYIPKLIPHPGEVSNDFSVSIFELLDPNNNVTELWTIRGNKVDVPFYRLANYKVWGATAMILSEFKQCIESVL